MDIELAFTEIFGSFLKDKGFIKAKNKHPYFIRCINNEIFHIITCSNESAYNMMGIEQNSFNIYGAVATLYRKEISLTNDVINQKWFNSIFDFYVKTTGNKQDIQICDKLYTFMYTPNTLITKMRNSLEFSKQYIFPIFDKVIDLVSALEYFLQYDSIAIGVKNNDSFCNNTFCQEGLLLFKNFDIERFNIFFESRKNSNLEQKEEIEKWQIDIISDRDNILFNPEKYKKMLCELEMRKEMNISKLRAYGIKIERS